MSDQLKDIADSLDKSYTYVDEVTVQPTKISYGDYKLKYFSIREVYIDGELSGEYHIKIFPRTRSMIQKAIIFFSQYIPKTCEIGTIDSQNDLNLEFQIYIKTTDQLLILSMMETMEMIDKKFVFIL